MPPEVTVKARVLLLWSAKFCMLENIAMKNLRRCTAAILALTAGFLFGPISLASAQDTKLIPLKVGVLKMAALTNPWTAKERGMFKKQGLDVTLIEFRTGNEAVAAHRGGSVDIILSIPGTAMTAVERGFDLLAISQNEVAKAKGPDSGSVQVLKDFSL